ncbi:MAG: bifunctional DNA primase/polymerase [Gemmatimonadota bacterium]
MIEKVKIAESYARERGWQLFPTDPETDALPIDWEHRATSDPNEVRWLWDEEHPEGNPALRCGPRSGVLVLDVDPQQGGGLLLDRLEEELGRLPDTLIARTGGGGLHLFFTWIDLGRAALQPWGSDAGLDVRAGTTEEGAFVWLPPTTREEHDRRAYEWRNPDTPVADLPTAWVEAIKGERAAAGPERPTAEEAAGPKETGAEEAGAEATREEAAVWTPDDLARAFSEADRIERTSPMLLWKHSMSCLVAAWNSGASTVVASDVAAVVRKGLEGGPERRVLWICEMPRVQTAHYVVNAGLDTSDLAEAGDRGLLEVIGLRGTPHRSWRDLEARIADFDPDVIYVDTLAALLHRFAAADPPDPGDASGWQRPWATWLADWSRRWAHDGLAVVVRSPETDPGKLARAGAGSAGADVLLCLLPGKAEHGDVREIRTVGGRGARAGETTYARFLESGSYGRLVPLTSEQARELEREESGPDVEDAARPYVRVVEAVEEDPGAMSSELYNQVRGREKAFRKIRDRLVEWDLIEDRSGPDDRGHRWYVVEGVDPERARRRILDELRSASI